MQLIGKFCPVCNEKVAIIAGAHGCDRCEVGWHDDCVQEAAICPGCSMDVDAPAQDNATTGDSAPTTDIEYVSGFGMMAGIILAAAQLWFVLLLSVVAWVVLQKFRVRARPEVSLVVSIIIGETLGALIAVAVARPGFLPMSAALLIELLGVQAVAFLLYFRQTSTWAIILAFHCLYIILCRYPMLSQPLEPPLTYHGVMGLIGLKALIIWLLIVFLRSLKPAKPVAAKNA